MDANPDVVAGANPDLLADTVRAKRAAIDNDLADLRVQLVRADPRPRIGRRLEELDARRLAMNAWPVAAGAAALWLWNRRRQRVDSLEQLLYYGLSDIYEAEQQLLPALERMCRRAWDHQLEKAFAQHHLETEGHIDRLHRVFRSIDMRPRRTRSSSITGLIEDGERLLARSVDREVSDAWMIATAQRVEHVEIATYGTLRTYAHTLGFTFAAQLLQQTLEEERAADEKLTRLAERFINPQTIRRRASA
ncbi:MAG: ferritin-like domain-containing protein [Vicinamibacterales bacterium]